MITYEEYISHLRARATGEQLDPIAKGILETHSKVAKLEKALALLKEPAEKPCKDEVIALLEKANANWPTQRGREYLAKAIALLKEPAEKPTSEFVKKCFRRIDDKLEIPEPNKLFVLRNSLKEACARLEAAEAEIRKLRRKVKDSK